MKALHVLTLGVLAVALCSCATVQEVPFDRTAQNQIKTIAIITPKFPKDASVVLASTVGQSFGALGAIIDGTMEANRDEQFRDILEAQKFSAQTAFANHLAQRLMARGYTVKTLSTDRPRNTFLNKYPADKTVDAYLDLVVMAYGYEAAGISDSTPYRPEFLVKARLVRASDSAVLMQDTVAYNLVTPSPIDPKQAVTIAPNPAYGFKDFDTLTMNGPEAVKGLQDAIFQSADAVGNLL